MAPVVLRGLSAGINQLIKAIDLATKTTPQFDFNEGKVGLTFAITAEAEIRVLGIGTTALECETQKIILHLKGK